MRRFLIAVALGLASLPLLLHGQTTETARLSALMSSTHEPNVALVGYQAMGTAVVEFVMKRDAQGKLTSAITDFRIEYTLGQAETLVNMHIHRGPEGCNCPVVVPSNFGAGVAAGPGSGALFRAAQTTDPGVLAVIEEVLAKPSAFYVNVHSQSFPVGLFRGQLESEKDPAKVLSLKLDALATQLDLLGQDLTPKLVALATQLDLLGKDLKPEFSALATQLDLLGQVVRQLALRHGINPADLP